MEPGRQARPAGSPFHSRPAFRRRGRPSTEAGPSCSPSRLRKPTRPDDAAQSRPAIHDPGTDRGKPCSRALAGNRTAGGAARSAAGRCGAGEPACVVQPVTDRAEPARAAEQARRPFAMLPSATAPGACRPRGSSDFTRRKVRARRRMVRRKFLPARGEGDRPQGGGGGSPPHAPLHDDANPLRQRFALPPPRQRGGSTMLTPPPRTSPHEPADQVAHEAPRERARQVGGDRAQTR